MENLYYACIANDKNFFLYLPIGEHYSDEFTAINRFQKVPVIDHNGFILTER